MYIYVYMYIDRSMYIESYRFECAHVLAYWCVLYTFFDIRAKLYIHILFLSTYLLRSLSHFLVLFLSLVLLFILSFSFSLFLSPNIHIYIHKYDIKLQSMYICTYALWESGVRVIAQTLRWRAAIAPRFKVCSACGCSSLQHTETHCNALQRNATHCNILQHTATHCNMLQHSATRCNTLQHTATHCSIQQHTAKQCNTCAALSSMHCVRV